MSEPPLQVDPDGVSAVPRKVGHNLIDAAIAASAILISLVSLVVAIANSQAQEKLVEASTWPFIQIYSSDEVGTDTDPKRVISMGLRNGGIGPAKIESVRMIYQGHEVTSNIDFLNRCCGANAVPGHFGHGMQANTVSPVVMTAGQSQAYLVLPDSPGVTAVWDKLDVARNDVELQICYCSVFDECWMTDGVSLHPPKVKSCPVDTPSFAR